MSTSQGSRIAEEKKMGNKTNSPSQWALVVVMTLAVTVICNTVFLVVLVKISAHHPGSRRLNASSVFEAVSNKNIVKHVNASSPIELLSLKTDVNYTIDAAVEEEEYTEIISSVPFSYPASSGESKEEEEVHVIEENVTTTLTVKEKALQNEKEEPPRTISREEDARFEVHPPRETPISNNDVEVKKMSTAPKASTSQATTQSREDKDTQILSGDAKNIKMPSVVPARCWVPFARVFNQKCRVNEGNGIQSHWFDVEQFVMAMI